MSIAETIQQTLDAHVCTAMTAARIALPTLREVIAKNMYGDARAQAILIANSIDRRHIFQACVSWDLHDLIHQIEHEISDMIVQVTMWPDYEYDVTGNSWVETIWTPEAKVLAAAQEELVTLVEAIDAVIDLRDMPNLLAARA